MPRSLRVAVCDPDPDIQRFYQQHLRELGHELVCVQSHAQMLLEQCAQLTPEAVLLEVDLPDGDGIDIALQVERLNPTAIIVVSARHDADTIRRATGDHVMAYLVKPVKVPDLLVTLELARARFEHWMALHHEYYDASTALRDRKLIDQAKAILMTRSGLTEDEAYRRLRQLSFDKNLKMARIAEMVITTDQALEQTGDAE